MLVFDWTLLTPALVLLLFPSGLFFGQNIKYRYLTDSSLSLGPALLTFPWQLIDLLRAGLGMWLLDQALTTGMSPSLQVSAILRGGLLLVAITLQAMANRSEDGALAPFTYTAGLVVAHYWPFNPLIPTFALMIGISVAMAVRNGAGFFLPIAIVLGVLNYFFIPGVVSRYELLTAPAFALPGFIPWLFHRDFVVPTRLRKKKPVVPPPAA